MKDKILKLRNEGKSYNEIVTIVGCSKSTVSYHCGEGQKEKNLVRSRNRRKNLLIGKVERFIHRVGNSKNFVESVRKFNKRDGTVKHNSCVDSSMVASFTYIDVINKFGDNPVCYLTGVRIDLEGADYELDHIIPVSRGGSNKLSNLGLLSKEVNRAKHNMTTEEFIEICRKVTEYNK